MCQVSFEAGLQPQLFSAEAFCHARCAVVEVSEQHSEAAVEQEQEEAEPAEEIIAQDPPL